MSFPSPVLPALPHAWVVKCKKCGCTVTCRAVDPQTEHSEPEKCEPPTAHSVIVTCSCCWTAYRYSRADVLKGSPSPSTACLENRKGDARNNKEEKPNAAILIAASLIAAVRLNREEIKSSPIVYSKIADSIRLAEMIQARFRG